MKRAARLFSCLLLSASPLFAQESGRLSLRVIDADATKGIPCRITVLDAAGKLAPLSVAKGSKLAARPGVVYSADGRAEIVLAPGRYTVYAGRGFEYSVDRENVEIKAGETDEALLEIKREVPTDGLVAVDTHVHTLTYSGHGDATIDERALTLAGEGIELPILTDHDHLTVDQGEAASRMGARRYFTPVTGDEVTTQLGHFNAFPFEPGQKPPSNKGADWAEIIRGIRARPGDRFVVLNHPRDLHGRFRPFDPAHFNPVTGEHQRGSLGVDAIEVINSGAMQTDPMTPIRDWMAIVNRGEKVVAVGASDSHDVAKHIVGQGRTYVEGRDASPANLDVPALVRNLKAGRASVSLGLLAKVKVQDRFGPGDLVKADGEVRLEIEVLGPAWTAVDKVAVFANGVQVLERNLPPSQAPGLKVKLTESLGRFPHDAALVVTASGPGVEAAYWPIEKPYQPTGPNYVPRVWALTNPVYLDADGDGVWTSPLDQAKGVIKKVGTDPERLIPALAEYDEAAAIHAADLCERSGKKIRSREFQAELSKGTPPIRAGFARVAATLPAKP